MPNITSSIRQYAEEVRGELEDNYFKTQWEGEDLVRWIEKSFDADGRRTTCVELGEQRVGVEIEVTSNSNSKPPKGGNGKAQSPPKSKKK